MYAFTTQTSEVSVKRSDSRIEGRATFTIVVSRTIISSPMQRTMSASQRLRKSITAFLLMSDGPTRLLLLRGNLRAQTLLLLPQLGRELGAEVLRLEHLADLDLGLSSEGIGAAPDPFDRLRLGLHLPKPETGDQLFRLGEGPVDHGALRAREPDARALGARMEPLAREHHAGFHQLFVEFTHFGEELLVGEDSRFRVLGGLDHHHESHRNFSIGLGAGPPDGFGRMEDLALTIRRMTPVEIDRLNELLSIVYRLVGPHHSPMCSGSVHTFHTSSRGASKTRVPRISRSPTSAAFLLSAAMLRLLGDQVGEALEGFAPALVLAEAGHARRRGLPHGQLRLAALVGERHGGDELVARQVVQDRSEDDALVPHDLAVHAVKRIVLAVGPAHHVAVRAPGAEVHLAPGQREAFRAPPFADVLRLGPQLPHELARRVEDTCEDHLARVPAFDKIFQRGANDLRPACREIRLGERGELREGLQTFVRQPEPGLLA